MPNFKKPATSGRPVKKYNSAGGSKPGSRSEGHRGFHADAAPAKKRWNADDRAKRTGDRPTGDDRRPNWTPSAERPARPAYGDRAQRTETSRIWRPRQPHRASLVRRSCAAQRAPELWGPPVASVVWRPHRASLARRPLRPPVLRRPPRAHRPQRPYRATVIRRSSGAHRASVLQRPRPAHGSPVLR